MSGFPEKPLAATSRNGKRLHLRHGPIDLIIEAEGAWPEIEQAYRQTVTAFESVLGGLVSELEILRTPIGVGGAVPLGGIARRMHGAAAAHTERFITPMVAVAGGVADHILGALVAGRDLDRAFVNNGGDIALHLAHGRRFEIAVCQNPATGEIAGNVCIESRHRIRGIATSGWRGRSHSLGIADAVTVLACDAVTADAAATMIANQVTIANSANVRRAPANELSPDSDLGDQLVTVDVGCLGEAEIRNAIDRGARAAAPMLERGLIASAFLCLAGETRIVSGLGSPPFHRNEVMNTGTKLLEDAHA